jgi:predicted alpha/beta superfamily hydrolase
MGGAADFLAALGGEVRMAVEAAVRGQRSARILVGHSFGGLFGSTTCRCGMLLDVTP